MRRTWLLLGCILLCGTVAMAEVQVTLHGPALYTRTKGAPTTFNEAFPGVVGSGTLVVRNGPQDGGHGDAVTSASVLVNGILVFGPSDFKKRQPYLTAGIDVLAENSLDINLQGKPGSYLTVEVIQSVAAEGAAVVGPDGGVVLVESTASPLYGTSLTIPDNAVSAATIFEIGTANRDALPPPPNGVQWDGHPLELTASGPFSKNISFEVPFMGEREEGELRLLYNLDEATSSWRLVSPVAGLNPGMLRTSLEHFSVYVKGRATISLREVRTGFNLDRDSHEYQNRELFCSGTSGDTSGICAGMSLLGAEYFISFAGTEGEGLRCRSGGRWATDTDKAASCEAHLLYAGEGDWTSRLSEGFGLLLEGLLGSASTLDQQFFVDWLIFELARNQPVPVAMRSDFTCEWTTIAGFDICLPRSEGGHAGVVVGWQDTGSSTDRSGRFLLYDVNDNSRLYDITYAPNVINGISMAHVSGTLVDDSGSPRVFDQFMQIPVRGWVSMM